MFEHAQLTAWINAKVTLCKPDKVVICNGTSEEYNEMWNLLIAAGVATKLNEEKRPNSYLVRSDPADVARVESRTFICADTEEEADPTNNWNHPDEMRETLTGLF